MKKIVNLLAALILATVVCACGESPAASVSLNGDAIRPGRTAEVDFTVPEETVIDLYVTDEYGERVSVVVTGYGARAGKNIIYWNGTYNSAPVPEGHYQLVLEAGELTAASGITVGSPSPSLTPAGPDKRKVIPGEKTTVRFFASTDGNVTTGVTDNGKWRILDITSVKAGWTEISVPAKLEPGEYTLTFTLTDGTGYDSEQQEIMLTVTGPDDKDTAEPTWDEEEENGGITEEENLTEDGPAEEGPEEVIDEEDLTENEPAEEKPEEIIDEEDLTGDEPAEEIPEEIIDEEDLTGDEPTEEEPEEITEEEDLPDEIFTPSNGSPYAGKDGSLNYWTLPMDITDEAAVWEVLMQPVTVLDRGKGYSEKSQIVLRSEPDSRSEGVGTVTCITQGVHVLEMGETWSLIECYSSSFHDSPVLNWNRLVQGYVPTSYLKTTAPNQKYGIVIDKLTQRLYLFKDGKLFSTLLVSTGLSNEKQPYNETRSGEFLLTSAVGTFKSDNLRCGYAIRFNDGDLLHEVPYTVMKDGKSKDYKKCEAKLGTKASHGCIRVQRKKTPEGINMMWLWDNRVRNTKLLIWEDWQGRQITVPPDDMLLYCDPVKGETYHSQDHCYAESKRAVPYTSFAYAELDSEPYAKLTRCPYCAPALRKAEIGAINETYAPGGDHDPVLTEALKTCPRKLKK